MAIPSQTDTFAIVLRLMGDGEEYTRRAVKDKARIELELTDEEAQMSTSSGVPVYESRVGWGISYLARAGMLDRIARGTYKINERGREHLVSGIEGAEFFAAIRNIIDAENPWYRKDDEVGSEEVVIERAESDQSPEEKIGLLENELNDFLGEELLDRVLSHDAAFFEQLVVDLIQAMGYGQGSVTQRSCDFGIDGMISTDELGFRPIYTQAKRYALDHKVSRPEVQSFIGALNGAANGVFITTSSFTSEARAFAENYPSANIALIDGQRLTELMIKYDLGVSTERVIKIKRVDQDYFDL